MLIICSISLTSVDLRASSGSCKRPQVPLMTRSPLQIQGLLTFFPSTCPSSTAHSSMALACLSTKAPYLTRMCCFSPATPVNPAGLQSSSTPFVQLLHHFQFSNKATVSVLYLYSETCTNSWSSALIYKRYLHTQLSPSNYLHKISFSILIVKTMVICLFLQPYWS